MEPAHILDAARRDILPANQGDMRQACSSSTVVPPALFRLSTLPERNTYRHGARPDARFRWTSRNDRKAHDATPNLIVSRRRLEHMAYAHILPSMGHVVGTMLDIYLR